MNIDERLTAAITLVVPETAPRIYEGTAQEYCVYNYNTVPRLHANGRPGAALYLVQVHLLTAKGLPTRQKRQALKRALFKAGCTYPSEVDASDPEGQHFVLECQYTDDDV
ncbi:MAG: hypothetical protein KHY12_09275 [Firmicutes bacterium]|nr:hypothetical protein [Bacillota bacterium]